MTKSQNPRGSPIRFFGFGSEFGLWASECVMALVALGITGGIGAYKAVEVCRGTAAARPRRPWP